MKKLLNLSVVVILLVILSSCGASNAFMLNQNQNATQVHLASGNYRVVDKVRGSADVSYVLIFGGMKKKQLFANAYANMMDQADLSTGSRALVNMVTEEHLGGVPPFFYKRTVTVSANIIEFDKTSSAK
ncbi:MAG: hypothetical protein RIC30_14825 [Marinoscillum sp.]|uniref:DUF6567 family protein n=1 Tax=Marinoscillum sp. TaxID=2024838 RepID=UPI003303E852